MKSKITPISTTLSSLIKLCGFAVLALSLVACVQSDGLGSDDTQQQEQSSGNAISSALSSLGSSASSQSAYISSASGQLSSQSSSQASSAVTGTFELSYNWPNQQSPNVALATQIEFEFSEALVQGTDINQIISVSDSGQFIAGSLSTTNNRLFTFTPVALLNPQSQIQVQIGAGLVSASGKIFAGDSWQFTTVLDVYDTPQEVIDLCMNSLDISMLAAVNTARASERFCDNDYKPAVNKLRWNCTIQGVAIGHSQDMASNNYFDHVSPTNGTLRDRFDRSGYNWRAIGENIAAGQRSVSEVMQGWLASYGHCINIMSPNYTEFGFGYVENNNAAYRRYWTQNFAMPR